MIKKIRNWFDTSWRDVLLRKISNIERFSFLNENEAESYTKPLMFLNKASKYADQSVVIMYNDDDETVIYGKCIGFGTLINNVVTDGPESSYVTTNIKRFYVIKEYDEEKIITINDGMTIMLQS